MCKKSESITHLAVALAKFNANVQRIEKDSTNPHFRNKYASLDAIMDEIRPLLAEQGLSVIQMPSGDAEQLKLTTMLVHTSGEWIESDSITMRPVKNDPQGIGSATTYARRYGLCAFLGLSTGDLDDDGHSSSHAAQSHQNEEKAQSHQPSAKAAEPPASQPSAPSNTGNVLISEPQVKLIAVELKKRSIPDEWYRNVLKRYNVTSTKELSKSDASKVISEVQSYIPVPVAAGIEDDLPF